MNIIISIFATMILIPASFAQAAQTANVCINLKSQLIDDNRYEIQVFGKPGVNYHEGDEFDVQFTKNSSRTGAVIFSRMILVSKINDALEFAGVSANVRIKIMRSHSLTNVPHIYNASLQGDLATFVESTDAVGSEPLNSFPTAQFYFAEMVNPEYFSAEQAGGELINCGL